MTTNRAAEKTANTVVDGGGVSVNLREQREELVLALDDGGFPGSRAWKAARAAEKQLEAFDAAHPEVQAELKEEHARKMREMYQD